MQLVKNEEDGEEAGSSHQTTQLQTKGKIPLFSVASYMQHSGQQPAQWYTAASPSVGVISRLRGWKIMGKTKCFCFNKIFINNCQDTEKSGPLKLGGHVALLDS